MGGVGGGVRLKFIGHLNIAKSCVNITLVLLSLFVVIIVYC